MLVSVLAYYNRLRFYVKHTQFARPKYRAVATLRMDHPLRRKAVERFVREELKVAGISGRILFEVDEEKLKKIESLLNVDIRTKYIKHTLEQYAYGKLSLEEVYDAFMPFIVADNIK